MKKVNFVFRDGNDSIYDENVNCIINGEVISFKIEKDVFRISLGSNFSFFKKGEDSIFEIWQESETGDARSSIMLISQNYRFDVKVVNFRYKKEGKKYIIEYELESDEGRVKTIILNLE